MSWSAPPLFMVKTDFLLFLSPFYFERGVDIGEWIPTGNPAGIYIDLNPGSDEFSKLDPESPALPEVIGTEQQQEISHLTSLIATAEEAR